MRKSLIASFAIVTVFASAVAAQTLVDPFGANAASLSPDDLALMRQSIEKVLKTNRAGAVAEWKSTTTSTAGRSALRKTFTKGGLPCGEVEHIFTSGDGHRYVLPFCEVKGGQWKLAF